MHDQTALLHNSPHATGVVALPASGYLTDFGVIWFVYIHGYFSSLLFLERKDCLFSFNIVFPKAKMGTKLTQ